MVTKQQKYSVCEPILDNMTDDEKVFSPTVVQDAPFPEEIAQPDSVSTNATKEVVQPATIPDQDFPSKKLAKEVLSDSLNTKTKKIMQEFSFTRFGAIKVGKFEQGVSGEINISPAGIAALNTNGEETIAIDGETGDAEFMGTMKVGSLIAGGIITGEVYVGQANGNAFVKLDGANNRMIVNDGTTNRIVIGNV